ncbi:MAG: DUF5131 family protein [Actinomycetia bacterium]|nr:DUF5131 family protein [Actinomycetes bacterium]
MQRSKIEWTDYTFNPITGCGQHCWYCYAWEMANRFHRSFKPEFHINRLYEPWRLKDPSKIFVCSTADLFGDWIPRSWQNNILEKIFTCPVKHTFQLLTKSPENIPNLNFPNNVWVGVTITNKADSWRLDWLRKVRAKVKFVSFEPLLGELSPDLTGIDWIIIGKLTGRFRNKIKLNPEWVSKIVDASNSLCIPFFLKSNLGLDKIEDFPRGFS